jgi:hypothetical protein
MSNPQAELEATLAASYSDIEEINERQDSRCAFRLLDEQLAFDVHMLPHRACIRYVLQAAETPMRYSRFPYS